MRGQAGSCARDIRFAAYRAGIPNGNCRPSPPISLHMISLHPRISRASFHRFDNVRPSGAVIAFSGGSGSQWKTQLLSGIRRRQIYWPSRCQSSCCPKIFRCWQQTICTPVCRRLAACARKLYEGSRMRLKRRRSPSPTGQHIPRRVASMLGMQAWHQSNSLLASIRISHKYSTYERGVCRS